ncbi:MAG: PTS sugar transporter subunit IIA [Spirochaetaceae bacterium]
MIGDRQYFSGGDVIWNLRSGDKFNAIREIVFNAPTFARVEGLDLDAFADAVIEREHLQSTGLGHGVAVAHGRTEMVSELRIALGISPDGIPFDAYDGHPVHLIFVIANHPAQQTEYLQVLSTVAAMVRNDSFRHQVLGCFGRDEAESLVGSQFTRLLETRWSPRVHRVN